MLTDNGIGLAKSKIHQLAFQDKNYGIKVTKQRLQVYSRKINKKNEFEIIDLSALNSCGTKVILKIEL
jgi:hypothetical protein